MIDSRQTRAPWRSIVRFVAANALALAVVCVLLELLAGVGYRLGWWPLGTGLSMLRYGAYGVLAATLLAVADLSAFVQSRKAVWSATLALIVGSLGAGVPAYYAYRAQQSPLINDISTDTTDPPRFVAALPLRKDARNPAQYGGERVATLQKKHYPDIAPLVLAVPPPEAFTRALAAAYAMGWNVIAEVPAELRIEATDATLLFGFKDDIVIRVRAADGVSRVDVRSTSRIGSGDLGTNARRVRAYLNELQSRR
jgi:uncharacterized protein (DUF1499 family)